MNYITEKQIDQITNQTCQQLRSEKKVCITVRSESGETHWEGGINGHFFRIPTEVLVSVPESLAKLIAQSATVRMESQRAVAAYCKGGGKKVS